MTSRVFISRSNSNRDQKFAKTMVTELKKLGVTSFDPLHYLKTEVDIRKLILDAIRRVDALVVLVTEPYIRASSWVEYEIGAANALGKDVVVVKSPSISARDLPSDLASWRMIDFDPASPVTTARTLASSLAIAA